MAREERARVAARLREGGLTFREIGERMGLSSSYVASLVKDPDGSGDRARKARYGKPCASCGKQTSGFGATGCCSACSGRNRRVWTESRAIDALRDFFDEYGRAPTAKEHGTAPAALRLQFHVEWLPHLATLKSLFGSRAAAYERAGMTVRGTGEQLPRKTGAA